MVLQLVGLGIIAWATASPRHESLPPRARSLLLLAVAALAVVALQQVPLPASIWAHGARSSLAEGFRLLGQPVRVLPLSLTPHDTLSSMLCLIPPLAMFCAIVPLKAYRPAWLAAALLAGTVAGIMLGALQVAGTGAGSPWYLYRETNFGVGVGFFANANHMAILLVIALPFLAALGAAGRDGNVQRTSALLSILAGAALVLLVGIALNGSLAGYALAVPVLAASVLILLPRGNPLRRWAALFGAVSIIAAVAALSMSAIGSSKVGQDATNSVQSRAIILTTTKEAIADYMPFGSGLGSFLKVYRLYESPDAVTSEYVVHAHNDYAELALELGLPGVLLLLLFLAWWIAAVRDVWGRADHGPFARAASVASAAVLVHSLVDFPLRTAAIAACFAMCLALLVAPRAPLRQEPSDLRPTRHLVVR
jgi:O-antigen ligase